MFGEITGASAGKQIVMFLDNDGTVEKRDTVQEVEKYFPTAIISGWCRYKVMYCKPATIDQKVTVAMKKDVASTQEMEVRKAEKYAAGKAENLMKYEPSDLGFQTDWKRISAENAILSRLNVLNDYAAAS